MEDFGVTECDAEVVSLDEYEGKQVVVLDQTCFYPKGGGQDFDQGIISSGSATFEVEAVFFVDGEVKHIGHYTKDVLKAGDTVHCKVKENRRLLNTRLHSGGHLLDMAVRQLGWGWIPGKGAHYPDMSFVEYGGEFDGEQKQKYIDELQAEIDMLISKGSVNTIKFMTVEEMEATGAVVPDNLPKGKPTRAVFYDDFAVPCGGTHVRDIKDIGKLTVTNVKRRSGNIKVSYKVT
jgi:Ser-tRNA(Ala) deacylase AlaX